MQIKTNPEKTGALIRELRIEHNMTQSELAQKLLISDKTISKWECGAGLPDISMIAEIAEIFGVNAKSILTGEININESDNGNMKKIKFYYCKKCGGIYTSTSDGEICCCGEKLQRLKMQPSDNMHTLSIEDVEDEWYITIPHEMTKNHYIVFIAYITDNEITMKRLYPEQECAVRFHKMHGGKFVYLCSKDGLIVFE